MQPHNTVSRLAAAGVLPRNVFIVILWQSMLLKACYDVADVEYNITIISRLCEQHLHSPAHFLRIIIPASGHIQTGGHLLALLPTEAPRPGQVFRPPQDGLVREGEAPMHVPCTGAHVLLVMRQL